MKTDKPNQQIQIPFSEEDLSRLMNNETFDWVFDNIEVHLYKDE